MLQFLLTISDEPKRGKIEYIYKKLHDKMMIYAISSFQSFGRKNFLFDAEDAVQNTFMKIARVVDRIDFSRGEKSVKNYCFSILSNEISNILHQNEENFEKFEQFCLENEYDFIEELELREKYNEVVRAISELDERYSTTLYLVFCEEMTVSEIADMMGISTYTVYTRIKRGKKLLLNSLKGIKFNG